jgi:hypothetical protein
MGAVLCRSNGALSLREDQNRLERVHIERADILLMIRDELNELISGAVTDAEPNDFWRMPVKQAALLKVRIRRYDDKPIGASVLPNLFIGQAPQSALADVSAVRKECLQQAG